LSFSLCIAKKAWYNEPTFLEVKAAFSASVCTAVAVSLQFTSSAASLAQNIASALSAGRDFRDWHTDCKRIQLKSNCPGDKTVN